MIITPLLEHQKALLKQAIKKYPRLAIFAPLGCGKSLVALALAETVKAKNVLITCDKTNTLITWPEQIHIHTDRNYICLQDKKISRTEWSPDKEVYPQYFIVGYDYLKWHLDTIKSIPFDLWIGDESEAYKNPRTWRVKALRQVLADIPARVLVSGMPVSERIEDIFGQMLCLDDGAVLGRSITAFRIRYMLPDDTIGYGWVAKVTALNEIKKRINPFLVNLPPGHSFVLPTTSSWVSSAEYSELCPEVQGHMKELKTKFRMVLGEQKIELNYAAAVFSKMYQLTGGTVITKVGGIDVPVIWDRPEHNPKLRLMYDRMQAAGMNPYKYIIWCNFRAEAEMISNSFAWDTWKLTGEASAEQRRTTLKYFKEAKAPCALVLTYGFAKGLNELVWADRVIVYSRPYSYLTYAQAMARTARIGSKGMMSYTHLVVLDSPDEHVYNLLRNKQNFVASVDNFRGMLDETSKKERSV